MNRLVSIAVLYEHSTLAAKDSRCLERHYSHTRRPTTDYKPALE